MRSILFCVALIGTSAFAGTPEMVAQCEEVMRCEACQVANDAQPLGATKFVTYLDAQGKAQARRVPAADYDYIRSAGYAKTQDGHFVMCQRIAEVMKEPDSVRALGARAMFSATWAHRDYCPVAKP